MELEENSLNIQHETTNFNDFGPAARLDGKCTVMHIVSADAEMQVYFKISQLPAAILFSSDNDEIARFNPPFSEDKLVQDIETQLTKTLKQEQ